MILGQSYAQGSLYIRPKLEVRTYMGSTFSKNLTKISIANFDYTNYLLPNPFMSVKSPKTSFHNGLNLGVNVGWAFKNGHALELGWNQDATGSTFLAYGWSDQSNVAATNFYGRNLFKSYVLSERIELNYIAQISGMKERKSLHLRNLKVNMGTGFKFTSAAPKKKEALPESSEFYISGGTSLGPISVEMRHQVFATNRFSPFISLGFSSDINYGNKYIATLMLTYTQGLKTMEASHHYLDVYSNGSYTESYLYKTYSRGSGLQLQLSRRFQLYPWKKRKKT